jgi:hypothetical protein
MTRFLHRNGRSSERGRKTFTIVSSLDSLAFSNKRLRAHERGLTIAGGQTRLVIVYIGDTHIGCPFRDRKARHKEERRDAVGAADWLSWNPCLPTETEPALCGCSSADA